MQTGQFIERADKTTRILDVRYETLPERGAPKAVSQAEALEWAAVLRSCSAWDALQIHLWLGCATAVRGGISSAQRQFPALAALLRGELNYAIPRFPVRRRVTSATMPTAWPGVFLAELQFSTIDEIFEQGLHQYLDVAADQIKQRRCRIVQHLYLSAVSRHRR